MFRIDGRVVFIAGDAGSLTLPVDGGYTARQQVSGKG